MSRESILEDFMSRVSAENARQPEFIQAVREVAADALPIQKNSPTYNDARVMERLTIPDRAIHFRVVWQDDAGAVRINRGWRIQYLNALGPYKGGLRFHPSVTTSVLKFLAFEQVFKNALTGLPLGGAKGGSDFDPAPCSNAEIMRFCQAFMAELAHYIGPDEDVPAGDVNVGTREIGYMFGAYKRHFRKFHGAMTGKGLQFGGSALREEATGYGLIYFVEQMLGRLDETLEGRRVTISGAGNVAIHAAEKAMASGARVVSVSDSKGRLVCEDGFGRDAIEWVRSRKARGERLYDPPKDLRARWDDDRKPWDLGCDIALPCATENELDENDARALIDAGCKLLAEGANMPLTGEALRRIKAAGIVHAPGKAANAGGVALSGLEMSQNAHGLYRPLSSLDAELRRIMAHIHDLCADEGGTADGIDYQKGANIAAFRKVADAMISYGVI